jgi:DNA-binding response OmpR family regulator
MRKIICVEDDLPTHQLLAKSLGADYDLIPCYTIAEAKRALDVIHDVAAIVLDKGLPDGDGLSICHYLRSKNGPYIPILILSAAHSESEKVEAFQAGADDYITKPFGLKELKARVDSRLKNSSTKIVASELEIDRNSQRVYSRGANQLHEIPLTNTEYKILVALALSMNRALTRERLLSEVWGSNCHIGDRAIDSHVCNLRKKISQTAVRLEAVHGQGYRLLSEPPVYSR